MGRGALPGFASPTCSLEAEGGVREIDGVRGRVTKAKAWRKQPGSRLDGLGMGWVRSVDLPGISLRCESFSSSPGHQELPLQRPF